VVDTTIAVTHTSKSDIFHICRNNVDGDMEGESVGAMTRAGDTVEGDATGTTGATGATGTDGTVTGTGTETGTGTDRVLGRTDGTWDGIVFIAIVGDTVSTFLTSFMGEIVGVVLGIRLMVGATVFIVVLPGARRRPRCRCRCREYGYVGWWYDCRGGSCSCDWN
jgi:hypothetical protein